MSFTKLGSAALDTRPGGRAVTVLLLPRHGKLYILTFGQDERAADVEITVELNRIDMHRGFGYLVSDSFAPMGPVHPSSTLPT